MKGKIKKFCFEYSRFILKSKVLYYSINISEAFLVGLIIAKPILNLNDIDAIIFIIVTVLLDPVGIYVAGGYYNIKKAFMKRHSITESDFL